MKITKTIKAITPIVSHLAKYHYLNYKNKSLNHEEINKLFKSWGDITLLRLGIKVNKTGEENISTQNSSCGKPY